MWSRYVNNSFAFWCILLFSFKLTVSEGLAETSASQSLRQKVRAYRIQNELAILNELIELLAVPNVSANKDNILKNANYLTAMLQKRGLKTRLLQVDESAPVVFGELNIPTATKTIIVYMHYDGQPVNAEKWASEPWRPVLREKPLEQGGKEISLTQAHPPINGEARIYARSASDDKSPIVAMLTAIDALRAAEIPLSVHLKFFLEGEEEAGSRHLSAILKKYSNLLQADVWIFCDGPVHQTRRMQVVFGARGVTGLRVTTYGAVRPLHSGHYGNWAPNPIMLLTHLLDSMRDPVGKILIQDFYDDVRPLTETERQAIAACPDIDADLRHELGLAWTEGNGKRLEEQIMLPALNLRAIQSGGAAARNAIQTDATAVLGFRLVPDQTLAKVRERVETHIRNQGFHIVFDTPDMATRRKYPKIVKLHWGNGYPPLRTSMDLAVSQALVQVVEKAVRVPIVKQPMLGGSLPLFIFEQTLHTPVIIVPMVNHDNNQHAENENLRVQNLWDGIEVYASILARLGQVWK
ncbi:MAG: M20/M25/M40 family metallo-hydrolase [bacterium]